VPVTEDPRPAAIAAGAPPDAPPGRPRWHAHRYNRAGYYRVARLAASGLPRPARTWLARRLGRLVAPRFAAERRAAGINLAHVHPGRDATWLAGAVEQVFERFAVCFGDLLSLNRAPAATLWRHVAGVDEQVPTRDALAGGRGCVSITAHLGNWELAGRLLTPLGRPVTVVMAVESDPGVAAVLGTGVARAGGSVRFVRLDSPLGSVGLVAALRRGEVVAFQMDRALGSRGDRRVEFFGTPARFPLGPFLLAAAAGAPVVPAFCILDRDDRYRLCVEPAFAVERGGEEAGLRRAVATLERYVARYWDQWFNFFPVWDDDDRA
jgi:lauroyl/myristoyl acyltransferase